MRINLRRHHKLWRIMDVLDALIAQSKERRRRARQRDDDDDGGGGSGGKKKRRKKFMRRGDLKRLEKASPDASKGKGPSGNGKREVEAATDRLASIDESKVQAEKTPSLPDREVKRRLRKYGHPVTLFGESSATRHSRLIQVEKNTGVGISNDDLVLKGPYAMSRRSSNTVDVSAHDGAESEDEDPVASASLVVNNNKSEKQRSAMTDERVVRSFVKRILKEWADHLEGRPDEEKNCVQGKIALKTFKQSKEYLRPLLKQLKKKRLEGTILSHLVSIVNFCKDREYVKATDWYIRLSIGNAPWPIGVTNVGIHERTASERLHVSKTAHVMNDEEKRKYLTSMKRLMTYCQMLYPSDPSKMVR